MRDVPPPSDLALPVGDLVRELADHLGADEVVAVAVDLMRGAPRESHLAVLPYLTTHDWAPGSALRDRGVWKDYWLRTWGARALLHVWDDGATDAVVSGLGDEHWRPAEMCVKVAARHDVAGTGDGVAVLAGHERPRVRAEAVRALAAVGDTEHVTVVRDALDDPAESVRRAAARALERLTERLDLA